MCMHEKASSFAILYDIMFLAIILSVEVVLELFLDISNNCESL